MKLRRLIRHLAHHALEHAPALSAPGARAIEQAIAECEAAHGGEIRFVVETALDLPELWRELPARVSARCSCSGNSASGTPPTTTAC